MIKTFVIVILIVFCIHFVAVYTGLIEEPSGRVGGSTYHFIKRYVDIPVEWVENFIDERKRALEEEVEREKREIEEGVRETGRGLWNRIGTFIFGE